jgi:hypothetical protein
VQNWKHFLPLYRGYFYFTFYSASQETLPPILRYKNPVRFLKYHPHGSVLFVTFSVEEGLLLLANPLCEAIIKSCLARAQHMFPVDICHLVVESTHLHLIMVVKNPDDVSGFIGYFKTESAHMLNRVLGRAKRTVWCEGYDSPVVLTPFRALTAIAYLYSNPAKDNLVETIDRYPGVSSWKMFLKKEYSKIWKRLRRPAFTELPTTSHNLPGYTEEAKKLLSEAKKSHEFRLTPNAWLEAYGIVDPAEQEKWNTTLIARVKTLELRAAKKRAAADRLVMGRDRLMNQSINTSYRPKRSGKRMCCLSEDRSMRIDFINFLKDLYAKAKAVAERWKLGDYSLPYPLGLYPPSMPKLAEPLGMW